MLQELCLANVFFSPLFFVFLFFRNFPPPPTTHQCLQFLHHPSEPLMDFLCRINVCSKCCFFITCLTFSTLLHAWGNFKLDLLYKSLFPSTLEQCECMWDWSVPMYRVLHMCVRACVYGWCECLLGCSVVCCGNLSFLSLGSKSHLDPPTPKHMLSSTTPAFPKSKNTGRND